MQIMFVGKHQTLLNVKLLLNKYDHSSVNLVIIEKSLDMFLTYLIDWMLLLYEGKEVLTTSENTDKKEGEVNIIYFHRQRTISNELDQ